MRAGAAARCPQGFYCPLDPDTDRAPVERRIPVRKPSGDTSAALWAGPAFLTGKIPGATSPKGLTAHARAVFGGVAPAPLAVRSAQPQAS